MNVIEVSNLEKRYGTHSAVKSLSFTVESGTLFAFLGSNGAGKSTTIGCLTTALEPTSGVVRVGGREVVDEAHAVRELIGVVFQASLMDPLLTVKENLSVRARFYGMGRKVAQARIGELSESVGISSCLDRPYGFLSGGQRRRADIARAILHRPSILFLDEPTAGLDPRSREQIWSVVEQLRASQKTTVFLTTHYLEETERADMVCIIDQGTIRAEGTPTQLRAEFSSSILTVRSTRPESVLDECRRLGLQPTVERESVVIPVESSRQARKLLTTLDIDEFEFRHGTMDDVFLNVTGGDME